MDPEITATASPPAPETPAPAISPRSPLREFLKEMGDESRPATTGARPASAPAPLPAQSASAGNSAAIKDAAGAVFDPALHAKSRDGSPSFTADGKFRRRRGVGSAVVPPQIQAQQDEETKRRKARMAAGGITEIIFKVGETIGGPDWRPIKVDTGPQQMDERAEMVEAWAAYCYAKDINDVPPGIMLGLVLSQYTLSRLTTTGTQERFKEYGGLARKIGAAFQRAGAWFAGWRKGRATRSDKRDDGVRENGAGEADSGSPAS